MLGKNVYGFCSGNYIFLDHDHGKYSEKDWKMGGYSKIVKIKKITTTIKEEIIMEES